MNGRELPNPVFSSAPCLPQAEGAPAQSTLNFSFREGTCVAFSPSRSSSGAALGQDTMGEMGQPRWSLHPTFCTD